jgi:hypothetical protein
MVVVIRHGTPSRRWFGDNREVGQPVVIDDGNAGCI